jgi:hypothetical protein
MESRRRLVLCPCVTSRREPVRNGAQPGDSVRRDARRPHWVPISQLSTEHGMPNARRSLNALFLRILRLVRHGITSQRFRATRRKGSAYRSAFSHQRGGVLASARPPRRRPAAGDVLVPRRSLEVMESRFQPALPAWSTDPNALVGCSLASLLGESRGIPLLHSLGG